MIDLEIKDKKDCIGCYGCLSICSQNCITMISDEEGFWYPSVDYSECIKCGLCIKVCPIINKAIAVNDPSAYACMNKNDSIRLESSSGGIFTLMAEEIIDNNGVVFGAAFDDDFSVIHKYVESKEQLGELRGSKYVQSRIGDTYKQVKNFLINGRQVLFSGTPCQIGGLKSYLQYKYDNLFCVDIVCHGVPSPKVWKNYINFHKKNSNSQPLSVSFRHKNKGWKLYSVAFLFKENIKYIKTHDKDLYMRAYLSDICLRPSCYSCKFKSLNRQSDITLADFWGIQNILPEMDDDKGTSLVFINSRDGQSMLQRISEKISYIKVDIYQSVKFNSSSFKSSNYNLKRNEFFNELDNLSFERLIGKYCSDKIYIRINRKLRSITKVILRKIGLLDLIKKLINSFRKI